MSDKFACRPDYLDSRYEFYLHRKGLLITDFARNFIRGLKNNGLLVTFLGESVEIVLLGMEQR